MDFVTLHTILEQLDAQQRAELAGLDAMAASDPAEARRLERSRAARLRMRASAVFFIERSWERIAPQLGQFNLAIATGKSEQELAAYVESLLRREPAYAWGWMRARMNHRLMQLLEECWPHLEARHTAEMAEYAAALKALDYYWFRQSPRHHLKAGYHTALAVACKWYGTAMELAATEMRGQQPPDLSFKKELHLFASASMTMLSRSDGWLWDSAGAEPLEARLEGTTLCPKHRPLPRLELSAQPDCGVRMGCPALRARAAGAQSAPFLGVIAWMENTYCSTLAALINADGGDLGHNVKEPI